MPNQTQEPGRNCLIVRGGWDGHQPVAATELFRDFLTANGFTVCTEDGPAVYADADAMGGVDLIIQCVTMSEITGDEVAGLRAAVKRGTGLVGWHGGIADSYRSNSDYLQLIGGQFACHPARPADQRVGDMTDYYMEYGIEFTELGATHPVTEGLEAFELETEQYWVLTDALNDVLATTTLQARDWDEWNRPVVVPAVWARNWGAGRVLVATPGHSVDVLENPSVRTIIERGMLWASR